MHMCIVDLQYSTQNSTFSSYAPMNLNFFQIVCNFVLSLLCSVVAGVSSFYSFYIVDHCSDSESGSQPSTVYVYIDIVEAIRADFMYNSSKCGRSMNICIFAV